MAINLNNNNQVPQGVQNQQQQVKPRTSGFTNIQRVLGANQGNKLGQTIGQGVQNITNKTQGQVQGAQQQFGTQIGAAQQDINKGQEVQKSLSDLDFSKKPDEANQAIGSMASDDYANRLANLRQGYKGPTGLQNQEQIQSQAQDLQQTGQGLLTSGGRQAALQRFVNAGPNYTQGKQRLDNLLLGQNTQDLREARRGAQTTAMNANQAIGTAANQAQTVGQQYNVANQDVNKALTGAEEGLKAGLVSRTADARQKQADEIAQLQASVSSRALSPEQYEFIKNKILDSNEDLPISTQELNSLIQANPDAYNINNVTNQGDVSAINALSRLSGKKPEDIQKIDQSQIGAEVNKFTPNQVGLESLDKLRQRNSEITKNYAIATPHNRAPTEEGGGWALSPLNEGQISYDQMKALAPYIQRLQQAPTDERKKEFTDFAVANGLKTPGAGATDNVYGPQQDFYGYDYSTLIPMLEKFNQFNQENKVGNRLSDLLASRNYGNK